MESTKREWNGDVDLGDGVLQRQHAEYIQRTEAVEQLVAVDRALHTLTPLLKAVQTQVNEDIIFIDLGMYNSECLVLNI